MRLILANQNSINWLRLFRHCGYYYLKDRKTGKDSFVRRLTRNFYPRFHLYLDKKNDKLILNLHLDQKKPSYINQTAHSADYNNDIIKREMQRILGEIKRQIKL